MCPYDIKEVPVTRCNVLKPLSASLRVEPNLLPPPPLHQSVIEALATIWIKHCRIAGKQYTFIHRREL